MDRLYRIKYQGTPQYAVERDGALHRVGGDIFGAWTAGDAIAGGLSAAGLRVLTARERRILALQYFGGLSQPQVARQVGISQIHVSRLTRRALVKLRAEIGPLYEAATASVR